MTVLTDAPSVLLLFVVGSLNMTLDIAYSHVLTSYRLIARRVSERKWIASDRLHTRILLPPFTIILSVAYRRPLALPF